MRRELCDLLRVPGTDRQPDLVVLRHAAGGDGASEVEEGVLFDAATRRAFPVVDGVPVLLDGAFPVAFLARHRAALETHPVLSSFTLSADRERSWSFSREWEEHFGADCERTWGYTPEERLEQLLMETGTERSWFTGKRVLDAGCGNAVLAQEVARLGAVVVGLDLAATVRSPECRRRAPGVHLVQGDLLAPPLAAGAFDLVFSIGVLHHTPDTERAFRAVARLVRPQGLLYLWLYRRPERFFGRYVKVPVYHALRFVVSRLPPPLQARAVRGYAHSVRAVHRALGRGRRIPFAEYAVSAYDDLTPRWRHDHTPTQASRWFHAAGFAPATLTHWDNPYGFGLVASRTPRTTTPGIHFGAGERVWGAGTTVLGRLHEE